MVAPGIFRIRKSMLSSLCHRNQTEERDQIIKSFNHASDKAMILLVTYALSSSDLNLQYSCRRVHYLEAPHNHGVSSQALGRVRRLGNPSNLVFYYEYYVEDTWDETQCSATLKRPYQRP